MLRAEVTIYPSDEGQKLIPFTQRFMHEQGLDYDFRQEPNSLTTSLSGNADKVFTVLQTLYKSSANQDQDLVMIVALFNMAN